MTACAVMRALRKASTNASSEWCVDEESPLGLMCCPRELGAHWFVLDCGRARLIPGVLGHADSSG